MARAKSTPDKLLGEWFWTDRWMGSSGFLLPMEPRGLYREMLTQAWRRGAQLPNDHETIQRATGCTLAEWKRCWPQVARHWRVEGDVLVNDTQLEVYAACRAEKEKSSNRGRKGAQAAAQARAQLRAQALAQARTQAPTHDGAQAPPENVPEMHPPDPDPERSIDQERSTRARGRVFAGERLKVSQAQHQLVMDEHGDHVDWLALYPVWDAHLVASGETFDTLVFIKQRAAEHVQARRALGQPSRAIDPDAAAKKAEAEADRDRRQRELDDQLDELWQLVDDGRRRELCAAAAQEVQRFGARMTAEARERAIMAAARRLLGERFPGRDTKAAELDRLRRTAVAS